MTIKDWFFMIIWFLSGAIVASIYLAAMWHSVKRMATKTNPRKYMFMFAILRLSVVLAFFTIISKYVGLLGLVSAFVGFFIARQIGVMMVSKTIKNSSLISEKKNTNVAIA